MDKIIRDKINYYLRIADTKNTSFVLKVKDKLLHKLQKQIDKLNETELYEFLLELLLKKHNEIIINGIIDNLLLQSPHLYYISDISSRYDNKNFVQLAVENGYCTDIIIKLIKLCPASIIYSRDINGNTLLHTLVVANIQDKFLIYNKIINQCNPYEFLGNNKSDSYIDLAKKIIKEPQDNDLDNSSPMHRMVLAYKKEELKNIVCDYYYRYFHEFVLMLTDDIDTNKYLVYDNLIFHAGPFGLEEDYEKYHTSKLLFRCIDCFKHSSELADKKLHLIIKKLIETGYPRITAKKDNLDFISYAIKNGYSLDLILKVFDVLDELGEEIPDWLYYEVLITYIDSLKSIRLKRGFNLYNYIFKRGFNLLNVNIDRELLKKYENEIYNLTIDYHPYPLYHIYLKKIVVLMHNTLTIQTINKSLTSLNYDKLIANNNELLVNHDRFEYRRLLIYDIDEVGAEKIALKIIENRKDAINESDEITKEEVIIAIEECKQILDEMYKTQGSSDYNKINTNFARADGEIIKNFENELIYVKKR